MALETVRLYPYLTRALTPYRESTEVHFLLRYRRATFGVLASDSYQFTRSSEPGDVYSWSNLVILNCIRVLTSNLYVPRHIQLQTPADNAGTIEDQICACAKKSGPGESILRLHAVCPK